VAFCREGLDALHPRGPAALRELLVKPLSDASAPVIRVYPHEMDVAAGRWGGNHHTQEKADYPPVLLGD